MREIQDVKKMKMIVEKENKRGIKNIGMRVNLSLLDVLLLLLLLLWGLSLSPFPFFVFFSTEDRNGWREKQQ